MTCIVIFPAELVRSTPPKGQTVHPDTHFSNRATVMLDIDSITSQPIEFGYNQNIALSILSSSLKIPLCCAMARTGNGFRDRSVWFR